MNERIRQIYIEVVGDDMLYFDSFLAERFAELIIRECVGIVQTAVDHREPASTYVGKIKEHFGVEE